MPNVVIPALKINASRCFKTALVVMLTAVSWIANAQTAPSVQAPLPTERNSVGDAPENPGPLAMDLSADLTHSAIRKAAKKVADWQLVRVESTFNQQWTYAALYDGMLAASRITGDPHYRDAMVKMSEGFGWKLLNNRFPHADDMALGRTYLDLYRDHPDSVRLADTKATMDRLIV